MRSMLKLPFSALVLLAVPLFVSAQRTELHLSGYDTIGGVFATDLQMLSPADCLISGYGRGSMYPGAPSPGLLASVTGDQVNWSKAFYGDSSNYSIWDTTLFIGLAGTVQGTTLVADSGILISGSAFSAGHGHAMLALLHPENGDTLWTTLVRSDVVGPVFHDAVQAADGSFYSVGREGQDEDSSNAIVARFDIEGELLWYRTLSIPGADEVGMHCFARGDTLVMFCSVDYDTLSSGISVARISSAGDLLSYQRLGSAEGYGFGAVATDGSSGFVLSTHVKSDPVVYNTGTLGLLRLGHDLSMESPLWRIGALYEVDGGSVGGIVYDPPTDRAFVAGSVTLGVDGYDFPFALAFSFAGSGLLWARFIEANFTHNILAGIQLTESPLGLHTFSSLDFNRFVGHAMDTESGALALDPSCALGDWPWAMPVVTPLTVEWTVEAAVLTGPATTVAHGLTVHNAPFSSEVCLPLTLGGADNLSSAAPLMYPNPVMPGVLVRFGEQADIYDALGRTIRTNVTQMAAPEQPGCYLVVTGERRAVLVVQE